MKYSKIILIVSALFFITILLMADNVILKIAAFVLLLLSVSYLFILLDKDKKIFPQGLEEDNTAAEMATEETGDENTVKERAEVDLDKLDEGFRIVERGTKVLTERNLGSIGNKKGNPQDETDESIRKFKDLSTEPYPKDVAATQQLSFLIERLLIIVRELFTAHTAVFFWYDKAHSLLSIQSASSASDSIRKEKLDIQADVLGRIIKEEAPNMLSDMPGVTEQENFRYYNSPQKIKSFLGVPVFHDSNLVGILAVDSKAPDAFGIEQMYSLGRFVRLVTVLIDLFAQKHNESVAQKRVEGFSGFLHDINRLSDETDIFKSIAKMSSRLVEADCFTLVAYNAEEHQYKAVVVNNPHDYSYIQEGDNIDLRSSMAGTAISSGSQVNIGEMTEVKVARFKSDEMIVLDGSFLITPIIFDNEVLGLLCHESVKKNSFGSSDVKFLHHIATMIGVVLHFNNSARHFRKLAAIDPVTGFYSSHFFYRRSMEEIQKAEILGLNASVLMIKIDEARHKEELDDSSNHSAVTEQISISLAEFADPFKFFGKIDDLSIGMFILNKTREETALIAEKIRLQISRTAVQLNGKSTTFTTSIGVVTVKSNADLDAILYDLKTAVKKGSSSGGNKVLQL